LRQGRQAGPQDVQETLMARMRMGRAKQGTTRTLTLDVPEEVFAALGSEERVALRAREALVMELLRAGQIGQSRAAELLGITRWDVLDLMGTYGITQGPRTTEELVQDAGAAEGAAGAGVAAAALPAAPGGSPVT
jgi:hypothetical protein